MLLVVALAGAGCRGPRVLSGEAIAPTPPATTTRSAAQRLHAANATPRVVSSFAAACRLSLVTPEGKTVNLDGAIAAAEGPDGNRLRLQAWKFDRPVIDLTVTPAGRFLFVRGQEDGDGVPEGFASIPAGGLPTLAPLLTELPEDGYAERTGDSFVWPVARFGIGTESSVTAKLSAGRVVSLAVLGPAPSSVQTIRFANHRDVEGIVWPMDWTLTGKLNGTVLLEDVELNPDLPASAFEPSATAVPF